MYISVACSTDLEAGRRHGVGKAGDQAADPALVILEVQNPDNCSLRLARD